MPGISITREALQAVAETEISPERWHGISIIVKGLLQAETVRNIDTATGRAAAVFDSIFTSAALRLLSNPNGARSIGVDSVNVTFAGGDDDIASVATLTSDERARIRGLRGAHSGYLLTSTVSELAPPTVEAI